MKALRILVLVVSLPVFVSAMFADAIDPGTIVTRTLQISSLTDDLDLICEKIKLSIASSGLPQPVRPFLAHQDTIIHENAVKASVQFLLPFFLRAPPLI
jgi:hypothetical protein